MRRRACSRPSSRRSPNPTQGSGPPARSTRRETTRSSTDFATSLRSSTVPAAPSNTVLKWVDDVLRERLRVDRLRLQERRRVRLAQVVAEPLPGVVQDVLRPGLAEVDRSDEEVALLESGRRDPPVHRDRGTGRRSTRAADHGRGTRGRARPARIDSARVDRPGRAAPARCTLVKPLVIERRRRPAGSSCRSKRERQHDDEQRPRRSSLRDVAGRADTAAYACPASAAPIIAVGAAITEK